MTACPLDPATPVTITERATTYTEVAVALDWAHLRARWSVAPDRDVEPCWCGAVGSTPCRTRRGRATADHVGRVRG